MIQRSLPRLAAALICVALNLAAGPIKIVADRESGVFAAGESAKWTVTWKATGPTTAGAVAGAVGGAGGPGGATTSPSELKYAIKKNAFTVVREGTLPGAGGVIEARLDEPGTLLVEVKATPVGGKETSAVAGAVFDPGKIRVPTARPADFDAFWDGKLAELSKIPMDPKLEPEPSGHDGVDGFKVTLNNINGTKVQGLLFTPAQTPGEPVKKYPAMLAVQWAGVYPLDKGWNNWRAKEGWIVLNIEAHDLPPLESKAFYAEQDKGPLKNYPSIGNDDRETSYFLRMYLGCARAADYLASRPDWDGKTLIVTGGSQGGMQTFVTAALNPKVTGGVAMVPAGADLNGPAEGRLPGWPMWYWQTGGKDEKKVRATAPYFDIMHLAPRIKAPMLVGTGGIDTTCAAFGVIAATNAIPARHELVFLPRSDHNGPGDTQKEWQEKSTEWINAFRTTGEPPK